jgi:hypothetical protein
MELLIRLVRDNNEQSRAPLAKPSRQG